MPSPRGNLNWKPLRDHLDLVAAPVADAVRAGALPTAEVAEIDGALADTAAFCSAYDVSPDASANCVVVQARRGERTTLAAVVVLATDRADVNKTVRKHLDARKITFADQAATEAAAGMTSGGITPVGLPAEWPVLIDHAVASAGPVVVGGGTRGAKILVDGTELAKLPSAHVLQLTLSA